MLFVKKSTLPRAGKGLFTDSLIKKGAKVVEYIGEIIPWSEAEKRDDKGKGGYVYYITKYKCIDAYEFPDAIARYANDARGVGRKSKTRNNSFYATRGGRAYIVASRNIKPGEEIFVWYGEDYWKEWLESVDALKKKKRAEARAKAAHKKVKIEMAPHHHPKRVAKSQ